MYIYGHQYKRSFNFGTTILLISPYYIYNRVALGVRVDAH